MGRAVPAPATIFPISTTDCTPSWRKYVPWRRRNGYLSMKLTRQELKYQNDLSELRKQIEVLEREKKHVAEIERITRE